jgi:hypothetical protein
MSNKITNIVITNIISRRSQFKIRMQVTELQTVNQPDPDEPVH